MRRSMLKHRSMRTVSVGDRRAAGSRGSFHVPMIEPWRDSEIELLPIVVGIRLDAEVYDRPLAMRLVDAIHRWQHAYCDEPICRPTVISDALYLSDESLQRRAVISLGHARVNALSAALVERLPVVYSRHGRLAIQSDLKAEPARLCAWSSHREDGIEAVDRLIDVELDDFLESVAAAAPAI